MAVNRRCDVSTCMTKVSFVGPLPPPVHGFAVINQRMVANLRKFGFDVSAYEVTPKKPWSPFLQLLRYFLTDFGTTERGVAALYMPISGGFRQLLDFFFAAIAKRRNLRIFVHHHSFHYLNSTKWHARILMSQLMGAIHIVLCADMGKLLTGRYGIPSDNIRVLSNAAFLKDIAPEKVSKSLTKNPIRLGFISNISRDKGIFIFFETLQYLRDQGIQFVASIAGPLPESVRRQFEEELEKSDCTTYVGAVYGEAKSEFYRSLDVLLFPSLFEAEPVTIWEALASGVPVICLKRGCIDCVVTSDTGKVVKHTHQFQIEAAEVINDYLNFPSKFEMVSSAARKSYERACDESNETLISLLKEMGNSNLSNLPS
jgi:glycosyltransferase involved in cell wall biosynthesis